ncbi:MULTISPECIES: hypothetical protein [Micrococcaceae]|uniref:hypothetical protein n=1 Tax=Micrococcaceae TaxID=1268 RepID=UPI001617411D|nr:MULTISPECIES: hypothetical protein [Micrococcaceae]MBB5749831.1 hypothetical protein [Micrococcus sp. TA1]HRO29285.1 hypothetical protein [Citricoccus sp.]HRO92682.1 hypothetical protein [Citricoccus sp.]
MSIAQIPLRLTAGAFILNSGINKTKISEEQAEQMRDLAANGVPFLKDMTPKQFKQFLIAGELGVGAALLLPFVPGWLAGAALTAFSTGLLSMYKNTEGMTEPDGIRPTEQGTAVAKDVFLFGIGTALMVDGAVNRVGRKNAAAARRAKKLTAAAEVKADAIRSAADAKAEAINKAREEQTQALRAARKKLQETRKSI